ncbi:MAG TPA: FHA domain-containing protein [Gemmataceae bacterium]|jgi:pSer/pThr/pTyr-binding forkhead associated (FHA) protein
MFERVILRVTNGERRGQEFVLENEADYILGRSRDCSCVLNDPFCLVSRHHCRVKVHAPFVGIQDLGSRNGTRVNGASIGRREKGQLFADIPQEGHAEHLLDEGDVIQIADYEFQVEFESAPPCAAAEPRDQEKLWSCDCASC